MNPRRRREEKIKGATNNFGNQNLRSPPRHKEHSLAGHPSRYVTQENFDNKQNGVAKLPSFRHEKDTAVSKNKRLMRKSDTEQFDQEKKPERNNKSQLKFTESTPRNPRQDEKRSYTAEDIIAILRDRSVSGSLIHLLRLWLQSSKKELQFEGIRTGVERFGAKLEDNEIEKLWNLLKDKETGFCDVGSAMKRIENSYDYDVYPKAVKRPYTDEMGNFVEPHDRLKMSRSGGIFNNPNGTRRTVKEVAFRVFSTLRKKYARVSTAREMIKAWDLDRSGIITLKETKAILEHMNLQLNDLELQALLEFIFKASQLDIKDYECDEELLENMEEPEPPSMSITCIELMKGLTGVVPDDFEDTLIPLSPKNNLDSTPANRLPEEQSLRAIKIFRERCNLKFRTHHEAWHFFEARSKTHNNRSEISPVDFSNCIKQLLPDITEISLECIVQNSTGNRGVVQFKSLTNLLSKEDLDRLPMERNPTWPGTRNDRH